MRIKLPAIWEVSGIIEIEAENVDDAISLACETDILSNIPLPAGEYVDGSFTLSTFDPEIIHAYQDEVQK